MSKLKIVIADNESIIRMDLKEMLEEAGHEVVGECFNGLKAIELTQRLKPDLVIMDIKMPEMDGIHVLKQIRSNPEYDNVQILMLTSLTDSDSFKKCFEYGADDCINKPIKDVEFFARFKAAAKTRNNALMLKEMFERIKKQNKDLKELNKTLKDTQFHMI